jgi:ubiquinone/menaquinone biosynthesis C-methylase UbiE
MKQHLGICYDQTSDFQQEQFNVLMALVQDTIPDRDLAAIRSMIDIGAGTGGRTLQSFRVFQSVQRMTAIEPDRDMMTVAREKYPDARVTYIQSTAEEMGKLKIDGAPLGAAMSNWALHWVSDKKKLMQDINALTQSGSYFIFSTCERLPALLQMVDAYVRGEFRIDGAQSPFYYLNLEEWRALLAESGWRIAGVKAYTVGHEVRDTQKYLEHWFTASTAKFLYGRHLIELSSWAHSDLIWMMNRAFPSEKNPEGMLFTEDVMFVVAQRE